VTDQVTGEALEYISMSRPDLLSRFIPSHVTKPSLWGPWLQEHHLYFHAIPGASCVFGRKFHWLLWSYYCLNFLLTCFIQSNGEIPIHWLGRVQDGYFVFGDDKHLCHITSILTVEYSIYDPLDGEWADFDPYHPISCASNTPILLKPTALSERRCIGLAHIVAKVHWGACSSIIPSQFTDLWREKQGNLFTSTTQY